jgi:hypothetical protein
LTGESYLGIMNWDSFFYIEPQPLVSMISWSLNVSEIVWNFDQ